MKYIIIILGIGWLLGQLVRYFLRTKLAKFVQQVNEAAKEQQRQQYQRTNPSGEIRVDHIPEKHKRKSQDLDKGGDYVDYEEVKD
ncbi:protein of unknown function [Belliella buryatensis]|uniref:DUF4834 domain-containing protein n=1 Tax=Belliella buryatensis TaxID=1500549 RepID=A0A239BMH8_9BACT|nr:DUF4834 family protein [Belliella buryatensis]SNS09056.1 protein of unknown function [Belliella buryatensis]